MTKQAWAKQVAQRTSVSALMSAPVTDASGRTVGHVREFAVSPAVDANHVHGLVLRRAGAGRGERMSMAAVGDLEMTTAGGLRLRGQASATPIAQEESYLMLERDLLDQQIIDVHGHKVVRVNDVDLLWEPVTDAGSGSDNVRGAEVPTGTMQGHGLKLRIAGVEVGTRGAVRRLLKGLSGGVVERVSERFRTSTIPWDFVDLIDRDPSRRVRLKIEQEKLSKMHPSDPGGHSGGPGAGGAAGSVHVTGGGRGGRGTGRGGAEDAEVTDRSS